MLMTSMSKTNKEGTHKPGVKKSKHAKKPFADMGNYGETKITLDGWSQSYMSTSSVLFPVEDSFRLMTLRDENQEVESNTLNVSRASFDDTPEETASATKKSVEEMTFQSDKTENKVDIEEKSDLTEEKTKETENKKTVENSKMRKVVRPEVSQSPAKPIPKISDLENRVKKHIIKNLKVKVAPEKPNTALEKLVHTPVKENTPSRQRKIPLEKLNNDTESPRKPFKMLLADKINESKVIARHDERLEMMLETPTKTQKQIMSETRRKREQIITVFPMGPLKQFKSIAFEKDALEEQAFIEKFKVFSKGSLNLSKLYKVKTSRDRESSADTSRRDSFTNRDIRAQKLDSIITHNTINTPKTQLISMNESLRHRRGCSSIISPPQLTHINLEFGKKGSKTSRRHRSYKEEVVSPNSLPISPGINLDYKRDFIPYNEQNEKEKYDINWRMNDRHQASKMNLAETPQYELHPTRREPKYLQPLQISKKIKAHHSGASEEVTEEGKRKSLNDVSAKATKRSSPSLLRQVLGDGFSVKETDGALQILLNKGQTGSKIERSKSQLLEKVLIPETSDFQSFKGDLNKANALEPSPLGYNKGDMKDLIRLTRTKTRGEL